MENDNYLASKKKMTDCESAFDLNPMSALKGMVDLYGDLEHTYYHDIADAIELWIDQYPYEELLDYIETKNDGNYQKLIEIIERTR